MRSLCEQPRSILNPEKVLVVVAGLEIQEEALQRYAQQQGGTIIQLFKIAETASKRDERKTFKEMVAFAKKNSATLDGLLFYKVDRAARNLFDYVELERLELDHGVPFISVAKALIDVSRRAGFPEKLLTATEMYEQTEGESLKSIPPPPLTSAVSSNSMRTKIRRSKAWCVVCTKRARSTALPPRLLTGHRCIMS